ncbi:MAG: ABC transporter permease [Rhodoferax sp.]|nr:ABC transporter permease [Rhodoferax sp.]MBP9931052.1 ABC transporter permease [Rhodoferax sp.]HQX59588.1 ABC transporter permease [Burkholderiaceae bacterium]HQZ07310.1 ABC transporter permease [Burkholderiaceae bacterium]HRA62790.1 ABC transporter permease [Burkholderiaceae bacterium]
MIRFILRRLLASIPVLMLVSLITFGLLWLVPGDPASMFLDAGATAEALDRVRREMGLDQPFLVRMGQWYGRLLQGDLGQSLLLNRSVVSAILERLPVTLSLTALAFVVSVLLGVAAGVLAAVRHGRLADQGMMTLALIGLSIPEFWLGLVLIWLIAVLVPIFPSGDYVAFATDPVQWAHHIALPTFSLACVQMGFVARMTRSSMLEVLGQDFIRTARAKGLPEAYVVVRHGLHNAMVPIVTVMGIMVGALLGGAVVTEQVFSIPGLGRLIIGAVLSRDFPVIQGGLLFLALIYLAVNLVVDLLYAAIDPRVRLQ